tara:strand:+ start:4619 stop:5134 length:516 start_codon:yes stop_codon:yes gene_type:complete
MADLKMNLSQLETKRDELIKEIDATSKDMTNKTYDVDFVSNANINKTLSHLDKNYKWTVKNAALLINLHEALKAEKTRISKESVDDAVVSLKTVPLNTLYSALTTLEGTGVSQAKAFTTLLTQVGFNISEAMKTMQQANKEIQALHVSLSEIEKEIEENNVETVTPDEVSK